MEQEPTVGSPEGAGAGAGMGADFSSQHTTSFPEILRGLGVSLAVTTYQAGKLILVRGDESCRLNTHFRDFESPMGMAYEAESRRLALGTRNEVWEFQDQPDAARKMEPVGRCDAAFLPRRRHVSGDIRVHELAWVGGELWAVNTRFSCLSTFDGWHSFVPRWRPGFVSALAPEDRCHMNGLCVVEGSIRFVTCLGRTDSPGGWRERKAHGGCVVEYPGGEDVVGGLSMPHSPRWHLGKYWVLESGRGVLAEMDVRAGRLVEVVRLPGFARGLDFCGPFAFVGLSQVRETAIFSGIPIMDMGVERQCGVWVVDLRTGAVVAFLRFSGIVQEIFAVQVLPAVFPELVNESCEVVDLSYMLPDEALRDVPERLLRGGQR